MTALLIGGGQPVAAAPDRLARAEAAAVALSQRVATLGVLGMLGIGVLTALDVLVLRALLHTPIKGSNEFLTTFFAVAVAAVLAGGLASKTTLEIDLLTRWLSARTVAHMRAFGAALYLIVIAVVACCVVDQAWVAWTSRSQTMLLQWRLWPFYAAVGLLFAACVPVQALGFWRAARDLPLAEGQDSIDVVPSAPGDAPLPTAVPVLASASSNARAVALFAAAAALSAGVWWLVQSVQPKIEGHAVYWAVGLFVLLWIVAALFVPIAASLCICGLLGTAGLMGGSKALTVFGSETIGLITQADLAVVPLFLMMGGFAVAGGLAQDIYRLAHAVFAPLRGGLALATIGGCAGFGAVTGSSLATIATIGPAAYPEMKARGYSPELSTGCLAAGGTLGVLIPPSTVIVLYALLVEQSIGTLYIALLVPALLTVLLYMVAIVVVVWRNPSAAPGRSAFDAAEVLAAARRCAPAFALFGAVFGGMFFGVFTATEAASVGTVLAFVIALLRGKLAKGALWSVAVDTTRSTSMLYFVMIGALMVTFFMSTSGAPDAMSRSLLGSGLPPLAIVTLIAVAYIVLGTAMDTITIMMITAPILAGLVTSIGYDPIWWGILTVILVEIGVVSPPFGLNLFVMKTIAPGVTLNQVFRGVMPFMAADIVKVVVLILFPAITLWLPSLSALK